MTNHRWLRLRLLAMGLILALAPIPAVQAQSASLASEDTIQDIDVQEPNGSIQQYTVMRDANNASQWYYVVKQPRLYVRKENGEDIPEFHLLRYDRLDRDNPEVRLSGGILQFSAVLTAPEGVLDQLKDAIAKHTGQEANQFRLAAMPMTEATVTLMTPDEPATREGGETVPAGLIVGSSGTKGNGVAPIFGSQKMSFSVPLTQLGADIYDALTSGQTGMLVHVEYTFQGLTPAAGFEVIVDWDKTHEFYLKNREFAAKAMFFGIFGAQGGSTSQDLRQTLKNNSCVTVNIEPGEQIDAATLNTLVSSIIAEINKELFTELPVPTESRLTSAPTEGGKTDFISKTLGNLADSGKRFYAGAKYSRMQVRQTISKKGTQKFSYKHRSLVNRKTVASGHIGVGEFPEHIRKGLITVVPPGIWSEAYFSLPTMNMAQELGVMEVGCHVQLLDGDRVVEGQAANWDPKNGNWMLRGKTAPAFLMFVLTEHNENAARRNSLRFRVTTTVAQRGSSVFKSVEEIPVVNNDDLTIANPESVFQVVEVDGSDLTFNRFDEKSELKSVRVKLQSNDRTFEGNLRPIRNDGEYAEPPGLKWIVAANAPVYPEIVFRLRGDAYVPWRGNGENLRNHPTGMTIELEDGHWKQ